LTRKRGGKTDDDDWGGKTGIQKHSDKTTDFSKLSKDTLKYIQSFPKDVQQQVLKQEKVKIKKYGDIGNALLQIGQGKIPEKKIEKLLQGLGYDDESSKSIANMIADNPLEALSVLDFEWDKKDFNELKKTIHRDVPKTMGWDTPDGKALQKKYKDSKQGFANITDSDMAKADKEDRKGSGAGKLGIHFPAKYLPNAQKFDEMPTEWKGAVLRELGYDDDDIEELNDKQKFMYDEWAGALTGHATGKGTAGEGGIKKFNEMVDLYENLWKVEDDLTPDNFGL